MEAKVPRHEQELAEPTLESLCNHNDEGVLRVPVGQVHVSRNLAHHQGPDHRRPRRVPTHSQARRPQVHEGVNHQRWRAGCIKRDPAVRVDRQGGRRIPDGQFVASHPEGHRRVPSNPHDGPAIQTEAKVAPNLEVFFARLPDPRVQVDDLQLYERQLRRSPWHRQDKAIRDARRVRIGDVLVHHVARVVEVHGHAIDTHASDLAGHLHVDAGLLGRLAHLPLGRRMERNATVGLHKDAKLCPNHARTPLVRARYQLQRRPRARHEEVAVGPPLDHVVTLDPDEVQHRCLKVPHRDQGKRRARISVWRLNRNLHHQGASAIACRRVLRHHAPTHRRVHCRTRAVEHDRRHASHRLRFQQPDPQQRREFQNGSPLQQRCPSTVRQPFAGLRIRRHACSTAHHRRRRAGTLERLPHLQHVRLQCHPPRRRDDHRNVRASHSGAESMHAHRDTTVPAPVVRQRLPIHLGVNPTICPRVEVSPPLHLDQAADLDAKVAPDLALVGLELRNTHACPNTQNLLGIHRLSARGLTYLDHAPRMGKVVQRLDHELPRPKHAAVRVPVELHRGL